MKIHAELLCPACLTQLPDNYPYDHVAIDRALTTDPTLFTAMNRNEQREVVRIGLARGIAITTLGKRLGRDPKTIRALLPADHPQSATSVRTRRTADREQLESIIRDLWNQVLPDTEISLRTGHSVYLIADTRRRLGLATHPRRTWTMPGGVR